MKMTLALYILVSFVFLCEGAATAQPSLQSDLQKNEATTIVLGLRDKEDVWGRFHIALYSEAFKRLGINVEFESYPLERLNNLLDHTDDLDGDVCRIKNFNTEHPNLILVEEPHAETAIVAYTHSPNIHLEGWDSLVGKGLKVDYRHGSKRAPEMLNPRIPKEDISYVHSIKSGLLRLTDQRSDVFISSGAWVYIESGRYHQKRVYAAGIMEKITFHTFLLNKHKQLAKELSEVIRKMKEEGLLDRYRREVGVPTQNIHEYEHN